MAVHLMRVRGSNHVPKLQIIGTPCHISDALPGYTEWTWQHKIPRFVQETGYV